MDAHVIVRFFKILALAIFSVVTIHRGRHSIYSGCATTYARIPVALEYAAALVDAAVRGPVMLWEAAVDIEATVQAFEKLASNFGDKRWTRMVCIGLRVIVISWVLSVVLGIIRFVRAFVKKLKDVYTWVWDLLAVAYRLAARFLRWIAA
ncbi:hypothetical protein P171DRAFT_485984 [Karstenula rhodostoma CBS 690.94]|uniref:Uncharacterized protein n=1 Tax=Karstenula rhodostoma CBS 690.94 TaxID=1392251 RepID=A0A9P4PKE2_9PLEO|nr:hypothetical protein P171DRAFT_485984 [Karstenula rhodostoma CBS 690.94]